MRSKSFIIAVLALVIISILPVHALDITIGNKVVNLATEKTSIKLHETASGDVVNVSTIRFGLRDISLGEKIVKEHQVGNVSRAWKSLTNSVTTMWTTSVDLFNTIFR